MYPVHDVDALLLLAMALASKRRPAELAEIIAAADLIQGSIPSESKLGEAFHRLSMHGLIREAEGGFTLTPDAQKIMTGQPRKADAQERILGIKENLSAYNPQEEHPPILVTAEQLRAKTCWCRNPKRQKPTTRVRGSASLFRHAGSRPERAHGRYSPTRHAGPTRHECSARRAVLRPFPAPANV